MNITDGFVEETGDWSHDRKRGDPAEDIVPMNSRITATVIELQLQPVSQIEKPTK